MHVLFCIFFRFRQWKNYWNRLRFDRVAVTCTLLRYRNHGKIVGFWFFQVRCAHKSGDVINFIIAACRMSSRLKWYKNCKNRLRLTKVIVKNKVSRFFMVQCQCVSACACCVYDKISELHSASTLLSRRLSRSQLSRLYTLMALIEFCCHLILVLTSCSLHHEPIIMMIFKFVERETRVQWWTSVEVS